MLRKEEPVLDMKEKLKLFMAAHWRGVLTVFLPLALLGMVAPFPSQSWKWCAYTLLLMAIFWVSECIPLAVTGFLPVLIFPLTGVMNTAQTAKCYINDSIMMFLGSLMLAYSVEQSGLHKRLAYCAIQAIGYSHYKLLLAMCCVTTFVSMWITNTAATTMMVPINFALLKVFEDQGILKVYEQNSDGEKVASDVTTCYFCAATFSATIGGIGTLVGTATNLVFKGLFVNAYPQAPDLLSFPKFSMFAVPYMIILETCLYVYLCVLYFGMFRPASEAAKSSVISDAGKAAAKKTIEDDVKKLGKLTFWEAMVIFLFGGAMILFFCRSPQIFTGWGDIIYQHFGLTDSKFVRDSALAMLISFLMLLCPSTLAIFKNCTAKCRGQYQLEDAMRQVCLRLCNVNTIKISKSRYNNYNVSVAACVYEDLPKGPVPPVLNWKPMNVSMPYSFMFLLGGGFALSRAASTSGLNAQLGSYLKVLSSVPNPLILFIIIVVVVFVTNFASNVAVCNVFVPIVMQLATQINKNQLWYNLAAGFSASYCFMIPVGTPGNLIVQSAASIETKKMIIAGAGPTLTTIIVTWFAVYFYAPIVWPELKGSGW